MRRAIKGAEGLIVTDSNRDRARRWNGSQDNVGFTESGGPGTDLLRFESADARIPNFDTTDPATETTAHQVGPVTALATAYGEPFAYRPEDRAAMAIDGSMDTAWRVADRSPGAVGQRIVLDVSQPIDHVVLTQPADAVRQRHITAVDVKVGDRPSQRVELDEQSFDEGQRVDFEGTDGATTVSITIAATATPTEVPGPSFAAVGFREIDFGLGPTTEVVVLPHDLLDQLEAGKSSAPLSIVVSRLRYDVKDRYRSDPEPSLIREFTLQEPLDGSLDVMARLHARARDELLQELLDIEAPIASERVMGDPRSSGWAAFDDDPKSAWRTPFAFPQGARLDVPLPDGQPVQSFEMTQLVGNEYVPITAVRVVAGDDDWLLPVPDPDADGTSTITLPEPVTVDELSIIVAEVEDRPFLDRRYGEPVYPPAAISDISIGERIELPLFVDTGCRDDLLSVDGEPVSLRLLGETEDILDGEPFTVSFCDPRFVELGAGTHRITSTPGIETGLDIDRSCCRPTPRHRPASRMLSGSMST